MIPIQFETVFLEKVESIFMQVSLTFESWLRIFEVPGFFKFFLFSIDTINTQGKNC